MTDFSNIFLDKCIDFINKDEIKEYFKKIMTPMFNTVLSELFPYILKFVNSSSRISNEDIVGFCENLYNTSIIVSDSISNT